jgi:hypothetical protein
MNVKIRVFTHGLGGFVLSHVKNHFVYLPMRIRAFTHKDSCICTGAGENLRAAATGYEEIESRNTYSNFI